jgi:hypothetical protein
MRQENDKREHSTKHEVDDLTSYESENSLGGAGVLTSPDDVRPPTENDEQQAGSIKPPLVDEEPKEVIKYRGDYNDGIDFAIVDDENKTNA